jgi:hydroxymethylpyrimidine pyrophosphatase-like HAD family hydrolase
VDLESRFTEAALQDVWIADYRNFAHGRHHWLAKRPNSTAVLAFLTPDDQELASRTLALIPSSVRIVRESLSFSGVTAGIAALGRVIQIAASAGRAMGIDPGRPGVPVFGRRIYHLNAFGKRSIPSLEQTAIERKTGKPVATLSSLGLLEFWRQAYAGFASALRTATFKGVAIDYDGTLCGETDRFGDLRPDMAEELVRLLRGGIPVGVATGRGTSVRKALRQALPKRHWDRVVVGYYNGGDVGLLSDERPDGTPRVGDALTELVKILASNRLLTRLANLELRIPQVTIEPKRRTEADDVWALAEDIVHTLRIPGTSVVRSSHSIDILAPGVDKRAVVKHLAAFDCGSDTPVLRIGDKGRYPGNDYLLLNSPHSLSVDEASLDPRTCWNIAPLGIRGAAACVYYLRSLRLTRKGARLGSIVAEGQR